MEHAIGHHLDVDLDDDPDLKVSFAAALAMICEEFRENWTKIYEQGPRGSPTSSGGPNFGVSVNLPELYHLARANRKSGEHH